jgi:hypothetical protein
MLQVFGTEEPRVAKLSRVGDIEEFRLRAGLDDAFALVAGRMFRREVRVRARVRLSGMLSGLERKTSWFRAEQVGDVRPDGNVAAVHHGPVGLPRCPV